MPELNENYIPKDLPHFVKVLPDGRWLIIADHHMLNTFATCEQKFFYTHVRHLRPKGQVRLKTAIGSWWSEVMSVFYEDLYLGNLEKASFLEHAGFLWQKEINAEVYKLSDPKVWAQFGGDEIEVPLSGIGGPEAKPLKIPAGAFKMALDYWDFASELDSRNWKVIATESAFGKDGEVTLAENDEVVVGLSGKPDLAVKTSDGYIMPVDHKSIDYINDLGKFDKPHDQFPGYVIALETLLRKAGHDYEVNRCCVNVAARFIPADAKGDKAQRPRFKRLFPNYSPNELEEYRQRKLEQASRLRFCIEENVWTHGSDLACHPFGGRSACEYQLIDRVTPGSREAVIKADFVQVEPWSPYGKMED